MSQVAGGVGGAVGGGVHQLIAGCWSPRDDPKVDFRGTEWTWCAGVRPGARVGRVGLAGIYNLEQGATKRVSWSLWWLTRSPWAPRRATPALGTPCNSIRGRGGGDRELDNAGFGLSIPSLAVARRRLCCAVPASAGFRWSTVRSEGWRRGARALLARGVSPGMIELHDAEQSRALAAISPTGLGPVSRYGSMRLSELVDLYLDRHSAQWKLNTKQTNADRCKLLIELSADPTLAEIDRPLLWKVVDLLKKVPHDRHKVRARFPDAVDFRGLIELANERGLPRLTAQDSKKPPAAFLACSSGQWRKSTSARTQRPT